jgi:hypothetical protein
MKELDFQPLNLGRTLKQTLIQEKLYSIYMRLWLG